MKSRISVALATYNGEKYLSQQLDSILCQLDGEDEVIISDDGSNDATISIIEKYQYLNPCIHLYKNTKRHGVIGNFENALRNCNNPYIFLSDQDDIWKPNKKAEVLDCFEKNGCTLVLHNANIYLSNEDRYADDDMYKKLGFQNTVFKTIVKNPYIGCCMAFKKELLSIVLPMPSDNQINIHDWWIAICALKTGKVYYCNELLLDYRIHDTNTLAFHKTSLLFKIKKRFNICMYLLLHRKRFKKKQ